VSCRRTFGPHLSSRLAAGAAAVVLLALAAPSVAAAADRYAAPSGTGPEPCGASNPCSIDDAVGPGSNDGDQVLLGTGTYTTGTVTISRALDVHADDGPVTIASSGLNGVFLENDAARIADLTIAHTGSNVGLLMFGGVADRVTVLTSGNSACGPYRAAISNSACVNTGLSGAVTMVTGGMVTQNSTLTNVTAIADGGPAIDIDTNGGAHNNLVAHNVIASSLAGTDLTVAADATSSSTIDLSYSTFQNVSASGPGGTSVTPLGTNSNLTANPILADPLAGDVHQLPGSPTLNAGKDFGDLGPSDLDGEDRITGPRPDIGADEAEGDAPNTKLTKKPKKKVPTGARKAKVRFKFTATEPATFECKLDTKPFKSCESPVVKRLRPGKHRFRVRATDQFLNTDPTPAEARFKIKRR
jgi:hypothetical protein